MWKLGAELIYGFNRDIDAEQIREAIDNGSITSLVNTVEVHKNDLFFIESGTVHAIGGGLRLMETQQSCDLTYRLYDWGRGREVHIEKGLAVIKREEMQPVAPFPGEFDCKYFSLERIDVKGGWSMYCSGEAGQPDDVQLLYILSEDKAVIREAGEQIGKKILAEEIYAVKPGEKITVEGRASIMRIRAKKVD